MANEDYMGHLELIYEKYDESKLESTSRWQRIQKLESEKIVHTHEIGQCKSYKH